MGPLTGDRPPTPPPLIAAVVRSGTAFPIFFNDQLTDEDREYLETYGMPNGSGYGIDYSPSGKPIG